jgi:flavin-dependent dehydrogenase
VTAATGGAQRPRRGHAVVVGASIAGLLAARALADHFERVTVMERDQLPTVPAFRAGVPQSRHLHVLLGRGLDLFEWLFPGVEAGILDAGAVVVSWGDALWLNPAGWSRRYPSSIRLLGATRELLEWHLRSRVASAGVEFRTGLDVIGLVASPDNSTVTGVRVRPRVGHRPGPDGLRSSAPAAGSSQDIDAAVVVDASGRSSRASRWLVELGYPLVGETRIDAFLGYATRRYRIPVGFQADWRMLILPPAPPSTRGGVVFPVEDGQWLVTLGGYGGDHPKTDEVGFLEFARSLRHPLLYETIRDAEPVSAIHGFAQTANQWRHFERLGRWPERFVVVGDAVCAFNPVYGQGMTVAAITAVALGHRLAEHRTRGGDLAGFARSFQRQVADHGADAWRLSTGEDLRYATTEGPRPGRLGRLLYRYADRVLEVANGNRQVQAAFLRVLHLQDPPRALFHPRVLLPALLGHRAEPLDGPTAVSMSEQRAKPPTPPP